MSVVINRDTISFATTFNVTITTREYSDPRVIIEHEVGYVSISDDESNLYIILCILYHVAL